MQVYSKSTIPTFVYPLSWIKFKGGDLLDVEATAAQP